MSPLARVLTVAAAITLAGVFVTPVWQIHLVAPQYPEGLGMKIGIGVVRGAAPHDLDNINELNHYVGMRVITPAAIPELRVMPWIVGALALAGVLAGASGKRWAAYLWLAAFAAAGVAGLADFWRWEHAYGHNLDLATAIIKIPGMSYDPPLIGVRQVLNFTAVSWPDVGGWLAAAAFALGFAAAVDPVRVLGRRRAAA